MKPWMALVGFKLCWLGLILSPELAGVPVLLYWLWAGFRLHHSARVAVLLITAVGAAQDFTLVQAGVFSFSDSWGVPWWMLLLWGCFALVMVQVMARLLKFWWLGALMGAIAGPMAYWGGATLGGRLGYADLPTMLLVLVPLWALLVGALVALRFLWSAADEQINSGMSVG